MQNQERAGQSDVIPAGGNPDPNPLDLHPIQVMEFLTAHDFKIF